jgi:hypothetical protein
MILLHVHQLLGNGLSNKFSRRQIRGKQSCARLRNNSDNRRVFSMWSASCPVLGNRTVNTSTIIKGVFYEWSVPKVIGDNKGRLRVLTAEKP